jgi:alkylated DNA nucleotide flippase Atl1
MTNLWRIKLEEKLTIYGSVVPIPPNLQAECGQGRMLISRPLDVQALIRTIPHGRVVTLEMLRSKLAHDAGTDICCPTNTGIFMRIVAEVSELDGDTGAPYWRVVKNKGRLNAKYPGGAVQQAKKLESEGLAVARNVHGAPARLETFEACLFSGWELP